MDKEVIKLLEQIDNTLVEINIRERTSEMMEETNKIFDKSDRR